MRLISFIGILLFANQVFAAETLAEIRFKNEITNDRYKIESRSKGYYLVVKKGREHEQVHAISEGFARDSVIEINELIWKTNYQKPKNQQTCTSLVTLKYHNEKPTPMCRENRVLSGRAYGLLSRLSQIK